MEVRKSFETLFVEEFLKKEKTGDFSEITYWDITYWNYNFLKLHTELQFQKLHTEITVEN